MVYRCPATPLLMDLPHQHKLLNADEVASAWRPPDLATLPEWKGIARIGIDTESRDEKIRALGPGIRRGPDNYAIGYSFAFEDGPSYYLPTRHEGGDNLPEENVINYLTDQCKQFDGEIVGANLPYDLDWWWENGILMPKVKAFRDVQVADPLINELEKSYSLDAIDKRYGGQGKSEEGLRLAARQYGIDPKMDMWRMAARHVGPYAADDAVLPLTILRKQEHRLEADELFPVWEMECKLLPILMRMTRRGVIVDLDRVAQMETWCNAEEQQAWDVVHRETGVRLGVGDAMNTDMLGRAMKVAGLPVGQTLEGNDSITKDLLFSFPDNPVAKAIVQARKVSTIRTTFINGTRKHCIIAPDGTARIHCTFNQIRKTEEAAREGGQDETKGVAYGRLSCSHPNMQNQPAADRKTGENLIGARWRSVFKSEPGTIWTSCDLKQQEPKWSFHYGALMESRGVKGVTGAMALCKMLNDDPTLDTYEPLVAATGKKRPVCKILWLARAYGNGDGSLCESLGLPTRTVTYSRELWKTVPVDSPEGQRAVVSGSFTWNGAGEEGQVIIDAFDESLPFLKVCAKIAKKRADEFGFVKLLSGRRCHFDRKVNGGYEWTHKAFNRIIQGTAAEQTKQIMIAVDDAGYGDYLLLQVHDELVSGFPTVQMGDEMADVMRTAVPMLVPTVVDVERGPTWGESMSIEEIVDGKKIKRQYTWDL